MSESSSRILEIKDTTAEAVDAMLKYMYDRDLTIIQENVMAAADLLRLANKYNIEGLQVACEEIIKARYDNKHFDMCSALHVFLCGYQLNLPDLEEFAARVLKS